MRPGFYWLGYEVVEVMPTVFPDGTVEVFCAGSEVEERVPVASLGAYIEMPPCPKHRTYQAKRWPTSDCCHCRALFSRRKDAQ